MLLNNCIKDVTTACLSDLKAIIAKVSDGITRKAITWPLFLKSKIVSVKANSCSLFAGEPARPTINWEYAGVLMTLRPV